jgi:hypothetical protein
MAKVVKAFDGVADAQIHPKRFNVGDEVTGALADVAVREGWAKEEKAKPTPKAQPEQPEQGNLGVAAEQTAKAQEQVKA